MMDWHVNYVTGCIESIDETKATADVIWHVIGQAGKGNPQALLDLCAVFSTDELVQDLLTENLALHSAAEMERERKEHEPMYALPRRWLETK